MKIRVGVIFGGESVEHEVSIITAVQAMENFDYDKYEVVPIYIAKDRVWYTGELLKDIENYTDLDNLKRYAKKVTLTYQKGRYVLQSIGFFKRIIDEIDVACPLMHGANGEDGSIQGYLEMLGIPYTGCNVYGAALGQDKVLMKQIFEANHLPITKYVWFFENEYRSNSNAILEKIEKLKYPVIVKPATLGSSVGITRVTKPETLESAIEDAMQYDKKIVVEEVVQNLMEVNCSVLGNYEYQETSEIDEIINDSEFLSYEDKYMAGGKKMGGKLPKTGAKGSMKGGSKGMQSADRIIPARISDELRKEVRNVSKECFRVLNLEGISRIDFLIDKKKNKVYINEPNTIPGSLAFYLWLPVGKSYTELLDDYINLAIKRHKKRGKTVFSFETNILQYNGLKGAKGIKGKL